MEQPIMQLKYGTGEITVNLKNKNVIQVVEPYEIQATDEEAEIKEAMENPIGTKQLWEIISDRKRYKKRLSVVIIVSDVTRPTPTKRLIPYILNELLDARISDEDITIIFALGIHRKLETKEMAQLVGNNVFNRYRCINHDSTNCVFIGTTKRGTVVKANREVLEADIRICVGSIELHYFAGYTGGYKSILPGICARSTIETNHKLMLQPAALAGRINSPVRIDIEEAGELVGCDFILNVVLNGKKQIVKAVAGDPIKAHREGIKIVDSMYVIPIKELADVVVVSAGGAPKDINVFQSQKALDNAKHAVKNGGAIILLAKCPEGLGEKVFERWINEAKNRQELIDRMDTAFEIGGHKAGILAKLMEKVDVYLISDLKKELVERVFFVCADNVNDAIDAAVAKYGSDIKLILMPYGASTLPRYQL
jgi:nickel-dependent lactate racemase